MRLPTEDRRVHRPARPQLPLRSADLHARRVPLALASARSAALAAAALAATHAAAALGAARVAADAHTAATLAAAARTTAATRCTTPTLTTALALAAAARTAAALAAAAHTAAALAAADLPETGHPPAATTASGVSSHIATASLASNADRTVWPQPLLVRDPAPSRLHLPRLARR